LRVAAENIAVAQVTNVLGTLKLDFFEHFLDERVAVLVQQVVTTPLCEKDFDGFTKMSL